MSRAGVGGHVPTGGGRQQQHGDAGGLECLRCAATAVSGGASDEFARLRRFHGGARLDMIWDGDGANPNAALTVMRHFDSATVVQGLVGEPPKTAWLVDYSLLERIITFWSLATTFTAISRTISIAGSTWIFFAWRGGQFH